MKQEKSGKNSHNLQELKSILIQSEGFKKYWPSDFPDCLFEDTLSKIVNGAKNIDDLCDYAFDDSNSSLWYYSPVQDYYHPLQIQAFDTIISEAYAIEHLHFVYKMLRFSHEPINIGIRNKAILKAKEMIAKVHTLEGLPLKQGKFSCFKFIYENAPETSFIKVKTFGQIYAESRNRFPPEPLTALLERKSIPFYWEDNCCFVQDNLSLMFDDNVTLPNNLKIQGHFSLYAPIKALPKKLIVERTLEISAPFLTTMPESLSVNGDLRIWDTPITALPKKLTIKGTKELTRLPITTFPYNRRDRYNYDETVNYSLNLNNMGGNESKIEDLSALEHLTKLQILDLSLNRVQNLIGLSKLIELRKLILYRCGIVSKDLSALKTLVNLHELHLHDTEIKDISPLSTLICLKRLLLDRNNIKDISGLKSLVNLQELNLWRNKIIDISGLSALYDLQTLNLNENRIKDVSALTNLTQLTYLNLSKNQIKNVSPLKKLIHLETLILDNNDIQDISPLRHLTSLKYLSLSCNKIKDISFLAELSQLRSINISGNEIETCSPLMNLSHLYTIDVYEKVNLLDRPPFRDDAS